MSSPLRQPDSDRPAVPIQAKAAADLKYIRQTMERASSFTAVPGWGVVAMGGVAVAATIVAGQLPTMDAWLWTWIAAAAVATMIGTVTMLRKAHAVRISIHSASGRRFVLSLLPPMIAAGIVTLALYGTGLEALLPGLWMLLYGAGVVTGGTYSVPVVPVMGLSFMALGALTLFAPLETAQWLMAVGFGVFHVVFGWIIARRYGG